MALYLLYLAAILLSAITAFIYRNEIKSRGLAIFVPYLALIFLQELLVYVSGFIYPDSSTGIVYNISKPVSVLVYAWFYFRIPIMLSFRKPILWLVAIYLTIVVVTFIFIQSITVYNSYLSLAGGFVATCCGIFFLFKYFNLDSPTEEKYWHPVIWITIGIVTHLSVINIAFLFHENIHKYKAGILGVPLYRAIPQVMSIFMYSCFVYCFYLCKKKS